MKRERQSSGFRGKTRGKPFVKGGSFGRDGGKPILHGATCSECGSHCEVPFKPNGKKPIFCSKCFKKEGGGGDALEFRAKRPAPEGRSFGSRPSFSPDADVLRSINTKLDAILEALASRE